MHGNREQIQFSFEVRSNFISQDETTPVCSNISSEAITLGQTIQFEHLEYQVQGINDLVKLLDPWHS